METEVIVKSLCRERHTLGNAEATTMTITHMGKRQHFYVNYVMPWDLTGEYFKVPISIIDKINGNGKNPHYVYVLIDMVDGNYYAWDLNKPMNMEFLYRERSFGLYYNNADFKGVVSEENNEPLPF